MSRLTLTTVFLILLGMGFSSASTIQQTEVELIEPANGAYVRLNGIYLRWEPVSGAASYKYFLLDTIYETHTIPYTEGNPHPVGQATEVALQYNLPLTWRWYVIAYDEQEQVIAQSEERIFYSVSSLPTPTPTPTPIDLDFNQDGVEDGQDVFFFSGIWLSSRATPNQPYFDKANLDNENSMIDESDLLLLREYFLGRDPTPTPTPPLPAPMLSSPPNGARFTLDEYNRGNGMFTWEPVSGAEQYEWERVGPLEDPIVSVNLSGSLLMDSEAVEWTGETPTDPHGFNYVLTFTETSTYRWRVRGLTAQDEGGAWSEPREFVVSLRVPIEGDLNPDDTLDYLDIFKFTLTWARNSTQTGYLQAADLVDDQLVDHHDLLALMNIYKDFQAKGLCDLPAPVLTAPSGGTVFTVNDIDDGKARIEWEEVEGALGYRVTFRSSTSYQESSRVVWGALQYALSESDKFDTIFVRPVYVSVQALCENSFAGEASEKRLITVQLN